MGFTQNQTSVGKTIQVCLKWRHANATLNNALLDTLQNVPAAQNVHVKQGMAGHSIIKPG